MAISSNGPRFCWWYRSGTSCGGGRQLAVAGLGSAIGRPIVDYDDKLARSPITIWTRSRSIPSWVLSGSPKFAMTVFSDAKHLGSFSGIWQATGPAKIRLEVRCRRINLHSRWRRSSSSTWARNLAYAPATVLSLPPAPRRPGPFRITSLLHQPSRAIYAAHERSFHWISDPTDRGDGDLACHGGRSQLTLESADFHDGSGGLHRAYLGDPHA